MDNSYTDVILIRIALGLLAFSILLINYLEG
jgi:hypothetical protein